MKKILLAIFLLLAFSLGSGAMASTKPQKEAAKPVPAATKQVASKNHKKTAKHRIHKAGKLSRKAQKPVKKQTKA